MAWSTFPRDASVRLLKKFLPKIGVSIPLSKSDLEEARDFFCRMEIDLAQEKECGREYDQNLLDAVCRTYGNFTPIEDEDFVDMDALNARLQSAEPWSPPTQGKTKKPRKSPRTNGRTLGRGYGYRPNDYVSKHHEVWPSALDSDYRIIRGSRYVLHDRRYAIEGRDWVPASSTRFERLLPQISKHIQLSSSTRY